MKTIWHSISLPSEIFTILSTSLTKKFQPSKSFIPLFGGEVSLLLPSALAFTMKVKTSLIA